MLARVPCSLQPPGRPIVRSSSHASRMCPNRDTLSFPCRALFWGGILEERIHHLPCEGTGTSCMYSTVLPQLQCGSAFCPAFPQLPPQPQGYASRSAVPTVAKWASTADQHLVRKFQTDAVLSDSKASALELSPQVQ